MNFEALESSALFSGIPAGELPRAVDCLGGKAKPYTQGAYLLQEGDAAGQIGVLLAGTAEVVREGADGNRTVQAVLHPGDLFAESFAAAGLKAMPVSVTARPGCEALLFPYAALLAGEKSCPCHRALVQNLLGVLAQKNLVLNARLGHLAQRGLRGKVLSYLHAQAAAAGADTFTIPLDRQGLADYLCADRSALSAELSRMRRDGLIAYRRGEFTLL